MKTTKSVDWSYPTSPNADRFKFKSGCWTVSVRKGFNALPQAVSGHATLLESMEAGSNTAGEWDRLMAEKVNNFAAQLSPGSLVVSR